MAEKRMFLIFVDLFLNFCKSKLELNLRLKLITTSPGGAGFYEINSKLHQIEDLVEVGVELVKKRLAFLAF